MIINLQKKLMNYTSVVLVAWKKIAFINTSLNLVIWKRLESQQTERLGSKKNFAFVTYSTVDDAKSALAGGQRAQIDGQSIYARMATPNRGGGRGGGRGGRGGFGDRGGRGGRGGFGD